MRVLVLNRSYHPDVEATGQLLTELCTDLAASHEVTVIAGMPNFVAAGGSRRLFQREIHLGVEVVRVRNFRFDKGRMLGRALGLLSYLLLATWASLWIPRPAVIVVETDPPVLGALGAFLKRWHRCRLVFYLQDLFPEIGLILGRLKPGLFTSILRSMTQIGIRNADRLVVLGEDMKRRVLARGADPSRVFIVPNWADTTAIRPLEGPSPLRAEWGVQDRFVVMYSGNLGLSQSLDHVLEAAGRLQGEAAVFLFVGEGAAKGRLQELTRERQLHNVLFLPYQPKDRLGESLGAADLHLIPLQRGLAGYIVPSKLYGILAAGRPYVAAVDRDSEVAAITDAERTGLRIEPDSPEALADAIRWCLANRPALSEMGRRGRGVAETLFDRKRSTSLFGDVLGGLGTRDKMKAAAAPLRGHGVGVDEEGG